MTILFFFKDPATTEIYTYGHTLSRHDALPISAVSPSASPIWSILTPAASERSGTAARSVSATGGEPFHATSASPVTSSFLVAGGTASTGLPLSVPTQQMIHLLCGTAHESKEVVCTTTSTKFEALTRSAPRPPPPLSPVLAASSHLRPHLPLLLF